MNSPQQTPPNGNMPDRLPVTYHEQNYTLDVGQITQRVAQFQADGRLDDGLAAAAGVPADAVLDLLAGRSAPRLPDLRRVLVALDLQLSDVLLPEEPTP